MGTRAQVKVLTGGKDAPVYLYRHWDGDCLIDTVFASIKSARGQERAHDPEYLARIIFEDMINEPESMPDHRSYLGESTGYGISTDQHGDIEYLITVDCDAHTVLWQHFYSDSAEGYSFFSIVDGAKPPRVTDEPEPDIIVIDGKRYQALAN